MAENLHFISRQDAHWISITYCFQMCYGNSTIPRKRLLMRSSREDGVTRVPAPRVAAAAHEPLIPAKRELQVADAMPRGSSSSWKQ